MLQSPPVKCLSRQTNPYFSAPFDKLRVRFFPQGPGNSVSEPVELPIKKPCYSKCFCFNSFPAEPTLRQAQGPVFFRRGGVRVIRSVSLSNCPLFFVRGRVIRSVSLSNWPLKHLAIVNAFSSTHFLLTRPFDKLRVRFFPQGRVPGNSVSEPVELAIIFSLGPVFFRRGGRA